MSTSKKTSSKSVKSPAPATKSSAAKPAEQKKVKVATVPTTKPAAPVAKPAAAPVANPAPQAAPAPAPVQTAKAVKPVETKPVQTTISARVNVGFGNTLSIRGEGAGLSWDLGVTMDCVEDDLWRIVLPESARGHIYKFLVNDLTWSTGPDYTAESGSNVTHTPEF
jgi:hypothetical protein